MNRRQLIAGLGSAAVSPVVARGQQADRIRRVGVLMAAAERDAEGRLWLSRFTGGLAELGWTGPQSPYRRSLG